MQRIATIGALCGLAVLTMVASAASGSAQAPATDQALQDCMRLPDPDRNITDCTTVIERGDRETTRSRAVAHLNRAIAYLQKGSNERGLADLNAAIALQPEFVAAYYNRALYYHRAGDLVRAKADYDQVLRIDPKMVNAYGNRGGIHYARRDFDAALRDFEAALRLAPDNAGLIHEIGVVHLARGDVARAIAQFDRAIALAPKAPRFRFSRGRAYARQGALELAREDFAAAHAGDKRHAESRTCLTATETALEAGRRNAPVLSLPDHCLRDTGLPA